MAEERDENEEAGELGTPSERWQRELTAADKAMRDWLNVAPKIVRRYINRLDTNRSDDTTGAFPIFWSNVNIVKAAMYARMPKADVSRRYKDPQDDVGRVAGEIMERLLNLDMERAGDDVDEALKQVIEDRLVPGMGQVWLRYEPTIVEQTLGEDAPEEEKTTAASAPPERGVQQQQGPMPGGISIPAEGENPEHELAEGDVETYEEIVDERIACDYVHWSDFLFSPARNWREVRWVARRVWMTRDELVERFGDIGKLVPLTGGAGTATTNAASSNRRNDAELGVLKEDPWRKAGVWEIWCKDDRKVYWKVKGFDRLLDERDDPHGLDGFFPCPRPLLANVTTSALVPKADYIILRRVYRSLEVVSERISLLEDAIRVVGAYDKNSAELRSMLSGTAQNMMIPVDNWAMFAEKGGVKGIIDWLPLDQIVDALAKMREAKAAGMQELYELTGLSDIMRGATVASETATAQNLKAQFASVRLQFMQGEFARFVQDLLAIKAQLIAEHFQDRFIIEKSLIDKSYDAHLAQPAVALLRDKWKAYYSLTVAPDSMALVNEQAEQQAASSYMTAFATFLKEAMPLIQMEPGTAPFLLQMLQATMTRFKFGKQVESVLDNAIQKMMQQPPGAKPPSPMEQAEVKKVESEAAKNAAYAKKADAEASGVPAKTAKDISDVVNGPPPEVIPQPGQVVQFPGQ